MGEINAERVKMTDNGEQMSASITPDSAPGEMTAALVYATCPTPELAAAIGRSLIEARLAACVNILPGMTSIYRWQGAIETANETVLIAKTTSAQASKVVGHIVSQHPYDVPAVVVLPVVGGAAAYLGWIGSETAG